MVVNLDLVVHHSCISSYFQYMMVKIASYLSLDNTSRCLTEIPNTLAIVLKESACAMEIFCTYNFKVTCDDVMLIFSV